MKNIEIKGVWFTPKKSEPYRNGKTSIFELYERPSSTKISVFNYWERTLNSIYGLTGNCMNFSIYGDIIDEDGVKHDVYITAWNNYLLN